MSWPSSGAGAIPPISPPSPAADGRRLASVAARLTAAGCVAAEEEAADLVAAARDVTELEELVARRVKGEPLAWLVGSVMFCDVRVHVDPGVYVPRWQTEPMARRAAALLPDHGIAVDLCTGSGAIASVLQVRRPPAVVMATDVDPLAVACAQRNGVDARLGHLDEPLSPAMHGAVDVMTAVVPYVPTDAIRFLPRDVVAYEPRTALDGGEHGLTLLSEVVARSTRWLRPEGWLLLELGGDQAAAVRTEMEAVGFGGVSAIEDDDGDVRMIEGCLAAGRGAVTEA